MASVRVQLAAVDRPAWACFGGLRPMPGIISMSEPSGPIFLTCCICSRKSSSVKAFLRSFSASCSACFASNVSWARSTRLSTSPMPRMRPGQAVGVEDLERVGLLAGAHELDGQAGDGADRQRRAAAGVAVDLGEDEAGDAAPRRGTPRRPATASWPTMASTTSSVSVGPHGLGDGRGSRPSAPRPRSGGRRCRG